MVDIMNAREESNSFLSIKNSSEVPCNDVAVSTDSGIRLDGLVSPRSTEREDADEDTDAGCGAGCDADCHYLDRKRGRIRGAGWLDISETDLEVLIPSYPGSPRSMDFSETTLTSHEESDVDLRYAVDFLQSDNTFLEAVELGDEVSVAALLRRNDTNIHQMDQLGRNALHLAMCFGNVNMIKMLLKAGINPNVKDNVNMTPLSLCLLRKPTLEIAKLLFDYGAILLPRVAPMDTGLFTQFVAMCTPTEEDEKLLELLVQKGALVNDPTAPGGRQVLHIAAMGNNCKLIKKLVELGAKLHVKNHRGETPKDFAILFKCKEAEALLEELDDASESSSSSESSESSRELIANSRTRKVTIVDESQVDWRKFTVSK